MNLIDLEGVRRGDAYLSEAKRLHGATGRHPRPVPLEAITTTEESMTNQAVYTVDEAAELLKVHPQTIRKYIADGALDAVKLGRVWRIDRPALERWWRAQGGTALFTDPTDDLEATDD